MMNLYMKAVLSDADVSEAEGLRGIPAPFALTAIQQVVSFFLFLLWMLVSCPTKCRWSPKVLRTWNDWGKVCLFALAFTGNIALNNYSIQLLPLSVNLIIRSCIPAATIAVQVVMAKCQGKHADDTGPVELILVGIGVLGAVAVVMSQMHNTDAPTKQVGNMTLGVAVCVGALGFKALNLVLAAILGSSCKLNALDTTLYMSVPVASILALPSFSYTHDLSTWPGYQHETDWDVINKVAELSPETLALVFVSGGLSLFYNALSWNIVHSLSAGTLAFAENFNNSATIAIAVLVGLDHLPGGDWNIVFVMAVLACISSFAAFSCLKVRAQARAEMTRVQLDGLRISMCAVNDSANAESLSR
eukprot:TRINITY_DN27870_c0_g1_i1.p1 TRINITY_DN27870_c0_g1~~TRINITY_DN27870_c0_g1_i1.p1  ORF type:complete len:419 (+),score=50.60 TRINITY_DN27870_c0_g1_i1:178-1257(+)